MDSKQRAAYDEYVSDCMAVRDGRKKQACTGMTRTGVPADSLRLIAEHLGLRVQFVGSHHARIRARRKETATP
jgi:hypothetical protein